MPFRRLDFRSIAAIVLAAILPARGAEGQSPPPPGDQAVAALTATIDRRIAEKWTEAGVRPAAEAGDAEFLRRVSLDLVGKIPTAAETRDFLDDTAPDKRARQVEALLASPAYVNHWTSVWRRLLLPEANAADQVPTLVSDFDAWLRAKVSDNVGYDAIAREIIALPLKGPDGARQIDPAGQPGGVPSPLAYYVTREVKPENIAAGTARTFLGIRIECAQCHDHPFARWKRREFWGYAAFFGGIQRQGGADQGGPVREIADRRELAIPGTETVVQAGFLDGTEPQWRFRVGSRVTLADWMTADGNPYFARAGVNRLWAQLFGTGLVDPVDDLNDANPASHPELLDELARAFAEHRYDPKFLLRALTASRAYQLTSDSDQATPGDPRLFSRMAVKGLSPDQLFDSIAQAAGQAPEPGGRAGAQGGGSIRAEFFQKFAPSEEKPTEAQTTILQALAMMNGRWIAEVTSPTRGATLGAVIDAPFLGTAGKIETLFLAALTRKPRPEELARLVPYVEAGRSDGGRGQALADLFWSLLNSSEFMLNH